MAAATNRLGAVCCELGEGPCFVGQNLSRLLVTTAWEGYGEAERAADPGAGFTYVLDGGFRGQQEAFFKPVSGAGWSV